VQYGRRLVFTDTTTLTTSLRVPARIFSTATLDALISDTGTGPLTFTLDIGADGSWEWQATQGVTGPLTLSSPDLAFAFEQYWISQGSPGSGSLDVPVRVGLSSPGQVLLTNLYVPPIPPDAAVSVADIAFGISPAIETDMVPVTVTLYNEGGANTAGFTSAFYATTAEGKEYYVGSAFVPDIGPGGTALATFDWNTAGFTGSVSLRVVVDPYSRLSEADKTNNEAIAELTVLTRPDLAVPQIILSDDEPVVGETVIVTLTVRNAGQAAATAQDVALFVDDPVSGTLVDNQPLPVAGETETHIAFTWVPDAPGLHRLFASSDRNNAINESDEGNNHTWRDVYIGFAGPLLLDSGSPGEPVYSPTIGYGVLDEGLPDVFGTCDGGGSPETTLRRDPDGHVLYRFDHLLPGHFYHLDVTLYECDNAGRQESIYVDGNLIAGPEDLGNGEIHHLSLLVDPALYRPDNSIVVSVEALGVDGAVVSQVNLHDVDYRYIDAGGNGDVAYTPKLGSGWLDGVANTNWGTMPGQSVRIDQDDNMLRYQFDHLDPAQRYQLHFSFWQQPPDTARVQRVWIDGIDAGVTVNTGDYELHTVTVRVPASAYQSDGSIVVSIVRINALAGALVNEIALEQETLLRSTGCDVAVTPYFAETYGAVLVNGQAAPAGTLIQAVSPRGDVVGCYLVDNTGQYGLMRIYGEDMTANPPIPGMRDEDRVAFRVDGAPAVASPAFYWQDDKAAYQVDLGAGGIEGQFILMQPLWNLVSFQLEPPNPLVASVLDSIDGRYDRVLAETASYNPDILPVYNSLRELHAGESYYVRLSGETSANLLVEGLRVPVTTPIPLHRGWNWVGYYPTATLPVTYVLQSIAGDYQRVFSLDKTFDPALPEYSTLQTMAPGEGYLIYASQITTLTYPAAPWENGMLKTSKSTTQIPTTVNPTPYFTVMYGQVTINGNPAPAGTQIELLTPRGEVAGHSQIRVPGRLNLTHIYGADEDAIPGFAAGEPLKFLVNGIPVSVNPSSLTWEDDKSVHFVELSAVIHCAYLPVITR
jgi:hypothetical protein